MGSLTHDHKWGYPLGQVYRHMFNTAKNNLE